MAENNVAKSGLWWKIGLVIVLALVVAVIIITKKKPVSSTAQVSNGEATQPAGDTQNPLEKAFKTGRVVLADFGRGVCIPCKAMKPILDELALTYKGKAEVLIFDIDEYSDLTEQYGVKMIPTQIFFDKLGKEVWRHEGFLEKEKIIDKFAELGVK